MAGKIRQPIDEAALTKYLQEHVKEVETPIELKQFGFGQSNPTYQIRSATGQRFVMRKKPPGKLVSQTAHQVEREWRVMSALHQTRVAVPKTYALCQDSGVIGTPFYVMEFLDGRIFQDMAMPEVGAGEREAMWRAAVEMLAELHRVDVARVGLTGFGRGDGFYDRQVKTWRTVCGKQEAVVDVESGVAVGRLPYFEELVGFFGDGRMQPRDRAGLVHGDYKIDNVVFAKTEPRVLGILDWEMSTIGHPLSDVCNLLMPFYLAQDATISRLSSSHAAMLPGRTPGLPPPPQLLAWYARVSGYDAAPDLKWGMAFNLFKMAAVFQGIAARYAQRQASSAQAKQVGEMRRPTAELAWKLAQEAGAPAARL
ncbi:hypothetical protein CDD82_2068 [Ophiocordyceps australis]|uniref:Aminoglycoside phosphotransferase domain-containing protein n=1 Tax=Ophiocordyceps australis TaxID=1399860 RepID=A0A2C5XGN4_9HYPO|nr:hypothetical protein CDD82_2068 [Ophiocordyceps australis]